MSPGPDAACIVSLQGCKQAAVLERYCSNESRLVLMCGSCLDVWMSNASSASLYGRCPLCSVWRTGTRIPSGPAALPSLSGDAAASIVAAMEASRLSPQVQHDILSYLNRNASWLTHVTPGSVSVPVPVIDWETVVIV